MATSRVRFPILAAMAARTTNVRFLVAALIAPFHDPLRLAEEMVVLDHLSRGRVDLIVAGGYVHEEFAMFDVPMSERGKRVTETVATLKAAFTGRAVHLPGNGRYTSRRHRFDRAARSSRSAAAARRRPGGPPVSQMGSFRPCPRCGSSIAVRCEHSGVLTRVRARSVRTGWLLWRRIRRRAGSRWRRSSCTRRMRTASGRLRMTWRPRSAPSATSTSCVPLVSIESSRRSSSWRSRRRIVSLCALPPLVRRDAD